MVGRAGVGACVDAVRVEAIVTSVAAAIAAATASNATPIDLVDLIDLMDECFVIGLPERSERYRSPGLFMPDEIVDAASPSAEDRVVFPPGQRT
jgi:hypothetical protein